MKVNTKASQTLSPNLCRGSPDSMWCRGGCFLHLTFQNRRECEIWANHHLTPSYTRLQRMGTLAYTLGVGHLFKYQMIEMHFHTNSFNASENCTLQKWGTLLVKTVFTCFSHFFFSISILWSSLLKQPLPFHMEGCIFSIFILWSSLWHSPFHYTGKDTSDMRLTG